MKESLCTRNCMLHTIGGCQIKAKSILYSSFCISVHDFRIWGAKTQSRRKNYQFPFHREVKYLTAVTGYLDVALGNKEKNHQRVITRNQHLISPFFILHWFWLYPLIRSACKKCLPTPMAYLNSWMAHSLLWEDAEMGYFLSRNIIFLCFMLTRSKKFQLSYNNCVTYYLADTNANWVRFLKLKCKLRLWYFLLQKRLRKDK